MIATSGDEAFVLLAMDTKMGLLLMAAAIQRQDVAMWAARNWVGPDWAELVMGNSARARDCWAESVMASRAVGC